MPSPQNGFNSQKNTLTTAVSGMNFIDSLLSGDQWAPGFSASTALTYSFPWATAFTASWASNPDYSNKNEPSSAFALTPVQQQAVREVLATWSSMANITFLEINDTASQVGDLRFTWTTVSNGRMKKASSSSAGGRNNNALPRSGRHGRRFAGAVPIATMPV